MYAWCKVQAEQLEGVSTIGSTRNVGITNEVFFVLFLQLNIHHVVFFLYVNAHSLALFGAFFKHFEVFYGVIGQVFDELFVVTLEEILSVECEVIEFTAINEYLTIAVHRCSRQLSNERIEHTTFGKVEGLGIKDNGVAFVNHFDFGTLHHYFAQVMFHIFHSFSFQGKVFQVNHRCTSLEANLLIVVSGFVFGIFHLDDIFAFGYLGCHKEIGFWVNGIPVPSLCGTRINHRAIRSHQGYLTIDDSKACKTVYHAPVHFHFACFFRSS